MFRKNFLLKFVRRSLPSLLSEKFILVSQKFSKQFGWSWEPRRRLAEKKSVVSRSKTFVAKLIFAKIKSRPLISCLLSKKRSGLTNPKRCNFVFSFHYQSQYKYKQRLKSKSDYGVFDRTEEKYIILKCLLKTSFF